MELRQYFKTIRKWLWLILLSTAVATLSAYLATRQQANIYAASTTLMVGRTIENPNPSSNDLYLGQQLAQTYAEIAKRDMVREATMEALGINWLPQYTVSLVPNTQLLEIRVVDTVPERAQAVADALASQLIEQSPSAEQREQLDRRQFVSQQIADLEVNIEETQARINELQDQLADMFSARQIADTQAQITALEQKLSGYQANYASLLSFLEGGINRLQVVESANLPTVPIGPDKAMTILLAAAIGLILALGAAFLLDYLDDTLKNPDEIRDVTKLSTLGAIMPIEGDSLQDRLVTLHRPKAPVAEAFRVLRTNIQFSALDRPPRSLVVTSPNPSEGKSIILANLGVVMAQQGQKVIILDTDLRRPVLHHMFQLPNSIGLSNALLVGDAPLDSFLQETVQEGLWLMTTGPLPPNPAELLGSARFQELLTRLQEQADVVLMDSPPTLVVTDAAILARQVDGVVLVIEAGITRRQSAANATESLQKVGARVLGVALNQLKPGSDGYYYYYYYTPGYYDREDDETGVPDATPPPRRPRGWRRWLPGF